MSWEVAIIIAMAVIPIYLQKVAEETNQVWFKNFTFVVSLFWYGVMLWVAYLFALANDASIATVLSAIHRSYMLGIIVLIIGYWALIWLGNKEDGEKKKKNSSFNFG